MDIRVNDVVRPVAASPLTPLLRVLREELGITSPKPGCEQGGCGACTVLIDGHPRRACLTPVGTIGDREVTTLEAIGTARDLSPVQAAFNDHYAAQCGYCTAGMVMAAHALVDASRRPLTRAEVQKAISGHVCRCTGYVKIIDAVVAASEAAAAGDGGASTGVGEGAGSTERAA